MTLFNRFYHDGPWGHDHDDDDDHDLENNALWHADHIELISVGIDIGSSGTQVIFSKMYLARKGEDLSSRYICVHRESLYRSPVALTPYTEGTTIDTQKIAEIVDAAYAKANMHNWHVHTGAVILTGEAIRRENAQAIGEALASKSGDFVCALAGHKMEALLAGYGSGAARRSFEKQEKILNIDMGGGTTKLALCDNGKVTQTAAIYIGGRLVVTDEHGTVTRLDPGGEMIGKRVGLDLKIGSNVTAEDLQRMADWMAQAVVDAVLQRPLASEYDELYLTEMLEEIGPIDGVMFSGGVAEYIYEREEQSFGDLGLYIGRAFHKLMDKERFPWQVLPAGECIRATVVGASEYTVQISGNTNYISDLSLLPIRTIQVLKPEVTFGESVDSKAVADAIREHLHSFDIGIGEEEIALAFKWTGVPSYERFRALADGIADGLKERIEAGKHLVIVLDGDLARTIGLMLKEEKGVNNAIISIDGIMLQDFDYIDIGRMLQPSMTVPVTIKSLLFHM